jgi:hypothetical protein
MAQWRTDSYEFKQPHNVHLYEMMMLADIYGNPINGSNFTGQAVDAFGRARMSTPLTLFDSSHRYKDNGLWSTSNTATTTYSFSANEGLINLNLDTTANAEIIRETNKVFPYQPGKSLQILNTFVFNPAKSNLRQRAGYFGKDNGIYLELDGTNLYLVERSLVTGSPTETRVSQTNWNCDNLLGNGPSRKTLDITKAQIMFIDIEWLGVGSVRCGFVIDGVFIQCHVFHHANVLASTYITTASLPLRIEIKNTNTTGSNSVFKQICSSVISEGGYELRGAQSSIGTPITTPKDMPTAGTFIPVVSLRLKSDRLDAIVILTAISLLGLGNNTRIEWRVARGGTLTSPNWTSAGSDSAVEYDLSATGISGYSVLANGYLGVTNQASQSLDILKEALFKFQLTRNSLTSTPESISIIATGASNGDDVLASMDWEEITR